MLCMQFASPDGKFDVRLLDGAAVPAAARILQQSGLLRGAYSTCEELEDYLSGTMGAYPNGKLSCVCVSLLELFSCSLLCLIYFTNMNSCPRTLSDHRSKF